MPRQSHASDRVIRHHLRRIRLSNRAVLQYDVTDGSLGIWFWWVIEMVKYQTAEVISSGPSMKS